MHYAFKFNFMETQSKLILHGVNEMITNVDGLTAWQINPDMSPSEEEALM